MRNLRSICDKLSLPVNVTYSVFHMISISLDLFYPNRVVMPHLRTFKCEFSQNHSSRDFYIFPPSIALISQSITMQLDTSHTFPTFAIFRSIFLALMPVKRPCQQCLHSRFHPFEGWT